MNSTLAHAEVALAVVVAVLTVVAAPAGHAIKPDVVSASTAPVAIVTIIFFVIPP